MKIKIKRIEHERIEDAPFVGALISGVSCNLGCPGCFHEYLKTEPTIEMEDVDIIREIKENPFNEGIIFGGLEWTTQPSELRTLISLALQNDLKVMIYTGLNREEFMQSFRDLTELQIRIKFGPYMKKMKKIIDNTGIVLASENQKIVEFSGK